MRLKELAYLFQSHTADLIWILGVLVPEPVVLVTVQFCLKTLLYAILQLSVSR